VGNGTCIQVSQGKEGENLVAMGIPHLCQKVAALEALCQSHASNVPEELTWLPILCHAPKWMIAESNKYEQISGRSGLSIC
jgi:hypothetical protein